MSDIDVMSNPNDDNEKHDYQIAYDQDFNPKDHVEFLLALCHEADDAEKACKRSIAELGPLVKEEERKNYILNMSNQEKIWVHIESWICHHFAKFNIDVDFKTWKVKQDQIGELQAQLADENEAITHYSSMLADRIAKSQHLSNVIASLRAKKVQGTSKRII